MIEHSFGCIEDQIAMGLHDFGLGKVQVVHSKFESYEEKLEKEAEEYATENYEQCIYDDVIGWKTDYEARKQAYIAGAEPREKQIQINAEHIRALQNQNGELTDKVKELEAQIEKMKSCRSCKHDNHCNHRVCDKSLPFWELRR